MNSMLSPKQTESSAGRWTAEPSVDANIGPANDRFPRKRASPGKRASRGFPRLLIAFCIGVAASVAWQSYGEAAREMIANSSPQLGWLTPQAAPLAQAASEVTAPATPSPDLEQLKAISLGLAVMRQSVDQLAAQLGAGQEQMTRDITKLQLAEQDILRKISAPPPSAAGPAQKPVPLTPPRSQAPPAR
jgi:PPE-repeat protein